MPKNKDLKRLARERMAKTGESYTAALAQLLAQGNAAADHLSEPDLAELAGMSTAAVSRSTGHDWSWWLECLNTAGMRQEEHPKIARHVAANFEISRWWVQSVVVGYERMVGLREIGQRREGTYDANKSKTLPVSIEKLFQAFEDDIQRETWLPGIEWQVRKATPNRSIRLDWPDGCPVDFWFTAKSETKSSVQIQHRKLASKDDIARVKAEWTQRIEALAEFLTR